MQHTEPIDGSNGDVFYEEWLSIEDGCLLIETELGLSLSPFKVKFMASTYGCGEVRDGVFEVQRGPLLETCKRLYFVDIPKGWRPLEVLCRMFPVHLVSGRRWANDNKFKNQRIQIGMEEVWFAEEKDFRRYYLERKNRPGGRGAMPGRKNKRKNG